MQNGTLVPLPDRGPRLARPGGEEPLAGGDEVAKAGVGAAMSAWWFQLRQRWLLAATVALLVLAPTGLYAVFAVPSYTSTGVLQVSTSQGGLDPMLALIEGSGSSEVETEVEIIRGREFVLGVFKSLRLQVVDPAAPSMVTTDASISLGGRSPTASTLVAVRESLASFELAPHRFERLQIELLGKDDRELELHIARGEAVEVLHVGIGELFVHDDFTLAFSQTPLAPGESIALEILSDGELMEQLMPKLTVGAIGDQRNLTNLVSLSFTHPDRDVAAAVVAGLMQRYLDQSLIWQAEGAGKAASFIGERLGQAEAELGQAEEQLRAFAQREKAVQLDTQARVTIENAAALEAERRATELQLAVIASVTSSLKGKAKTGEAAHLTANFFDDPVLGGAIGALSEAETQHAVLRATVTEDHPQLRDLGARLELQRKEVGRMLKQAQQNLGARKSEITRQLASANDSLAGIPDKDLQMARLVRDVEVAQKLYSFLLERHREAEIVEASTTIDKRIVDGASMPHRAATPRRGRVLASGLAAAMFSVFAAVWLASVVQRRMTTVEGIKLEFTAPVYGTVPQIGTGKQADRARLGLDMVWGDAHGNAAEAFRALCVSVTLAPATPGRGRIVQLTSSQPGEGKSTVISNLAISLRKSGARVIVIDLDLRKPVQHRQWKLSRAPGYTDLVAAGATPDHARELVHHMGEFDVDVLCAGSKSPDSLSSLMSSALERVLLDLATAYDYVLVDSPPAFVPDTTVVARLVDLVLVVARPGVVERGSLHQAALTLGRLSVPKGLVLNGVQRCHTGEEYGSYYAYRSVYGESDRKDRAAS